MPPRGGPEDKTPPSVVAILPSPGALNVPTDSKIEIVFSERMQRKTVEDAFFISPLPGEEIFFHWRGKKLKIEFSDTLKKNRTYVMTIGTKASDLRNNRLENSFSLAFSTGSKIDDGKISGMVYSSSNVEGTLVCAYQLDDGNDPDPRTILADYYTQCNNKGQYELIHIAPGKYRLFAIMDKDEDRKYTRGFEAIGVTVSDVVIKQTDQTIENINFQLSVEDTVLPYIKSAYAIDCFKVDVRFNEPVQPFNYDDPELYFTISEENQPTKKIKVNSCYHDSKDLSTIHLMTEKQKETSYLIYVQNIFDFAKNPIDTTYNSTVFNGTTVPDTIPPSIVFKSIEDSSTGIQPDTSIYFIFSEPMDRLAFEHNFHIRQEQGDTLSGKFLWKNPAHVIFMPDNSLSFLSSYQIFVPVDSIKDKYGNVLKDSLFSIYFTTLSSDTFSAIIGKFIDKQQNARGKIHLKAKSEQHQYVQVIDSPGEYRFENIFPGIYTLYAFRDSDGNGVYSFGNPIPFVPAERFVFPADSIKVRSRWPNEGNDIIME